MAPIEWSRRFLASTRGRIVARLRRGPATVEELALEVGLSENGIRVHLATLERDGWIYGGGGGGRGGPPHAARPPPPAPRREATPSPPPTPPPPGRCSP